jgi:serine/threonine-protein kinase RsbW
MTKKIQISCTTENLKQVRDFLGNVLSSLGIEDNERNLIVLAVDEVCANRIIHSNKSNKNNQLQVEVEENKEGILFTIKDTGEYYDTINQPEPNLINLIQEKRKGGLGLMLVKRIMDSIQIKNEFPYTTYVLFKKMNFLPA